MTTPTETPERARLYSHITKTRFLHIEDSLEIGKIRLFVGSYEKGEGMKDSAYHFLDVDDARLLCSDLAWGKPVDFTDYKGSVNGKVISRVLTARTKDGKTWLEVKNGPGKKSETGAVMPAGEPDSAVSIALTTHEARRMALAILAYLAAQETARAVWALYNNGHIKQ